MYFEEDKGDGEYVYELTAGQHDQNAWLDRHLATQARLRREGVLFDLQQALGRDTVMQREALRRRKEEEEREAEAERAEERKRTKQARKEAKEAAKRAKTWEHDDFAEGRKSMYILLLCLKKSEGANARELYKICVLKRCPLCGSDSSNYHVISVAREATRRKQPSPRTSAEKESDGEPGEELRTAYVTRAVQQLQHIQHSGVKAAALVLDACSRQFCK